MPPVKRWVMVATSLLLLRAVPSCSSDEATGVETQVDLDQVPALLAQSACKVTLECLGPAADVAAVRADCVARITRQFQDGEFARFDRAIEGGRVEFDGGAVGECTRQLESSGCDILTRRLTSICPGLVTGNVEPGDDCSIDAECGEGYFCKVGDACPGTCSELGSQGDDCVQRDDCKDGLICGSPSQKCIQPVGDGEPCRGDTGDECAPNSVCVGATAEPGTCKAIADVFSRQEGERCDPLATELCVAGLSCAAVAVEGTEVSFECEAQTDDTSCHFSVPEACPAGRFCVLAEGSVDGECRLLPGEGEPCGVSAAGEVPSRCQIDAVCVAGVCRQLKRLDAACTTGGECYSGVCLEGTCAPTLCEAE